MSDRPLVLQTEHLHPDAAAWLSERCELIACPHDDPRFEALLARAEGLLVRTYTRVDAAFLTRAPRLRCVARAGVGLDNIDLHAAKARGVRVVSTPDANGQAVAEFVICLLCDATRPRLTLDKALEPDAWKALRSELVAPRQLSELRMGIVGLGRVGSRVARACLGLGMDVAYHDVREMAADARHGATPMPLHELLAWSNVVSLHVDARASNRRLCDRAFFSRMKPDAIFINTARGFMVDDLALAAFLRDHPKAQALLDVHDPEPITLDAPLLNLPNAHLSPHLAASTQTAQANMSWVVRDLWRVLIGDEPEWQASVE